MGTDEISFPEDMSINKNALLLVKGRNNHNPYFLPLEYHNPESRLN